MIYIGNVKTNGLNHFIEVTDKEWASTGEKFKSYSAMCNTFVPGWYKGEKKPLNYRPWNGQKICVSCALIAYKKDIVDLIPNIINEKNETKKNI